MCFRGNSGGVDCNEGYTMNVEPQRQYHKRKREKTPVEKQRDKTWRAFSLYIRTRDCLESTGDALHGKCCTCGKIYPIGKLQAGHFMPGRIDALLFDEDQVHAQCYRCNVLLSGVWPAYYRFIEERYGRETIDAMIQEWFDATKSRELDEHDLQLLESKFVSATTTLQ